MSFVLSLKKLQYLSPCLANKSKYMVLSMREQVQTSRIIKGPSPPPAESFDFELQNMQENTLQIQLWDYDEDNLGSPEQNLLGVGVLEVPEEDYESTLFNIEDQVMSIFDPRSQEKTLLVYVDIRIGQENDTFEQHFEQQHLQAQQQYSQQVIQQHKKDYEQQQKEAKQQYEQQEFQKQQERNKQQYLLQEQQKQQVILQEQQKQQAILQEQQKQQAILQNQKRISVVQPINYPSSEVKQRGSVMAKPNTPIMAPPRVTATSQKSALIKKLKDSFNQQNSLQFLSTKKVVQPVVHKRNPVPQGNQVINKVVKQIGTKVITVPGVVVSQPARVIEKRTSIKKLYL